MGNVGRQLLLKNLLEIGKNTDVKLRVLKTLAWKEVSGNGLQ